MRKIVAAAGAALLAVALTACGDGTGQSVGAACEASSTARAELGTHVSEALTLIETDGNAAVAELDAALASATAMSDGVLNIEVAAAIDEIVAGTTTLRDSLAALMLNPETANASDVTSITTTFNDSISTYYQLCS